MSLTAAIPLPLTEGLAKRGGIWDWLPFPIPIPKKVKEVLNTPEMERKVQNFFEKLICEAGKQKSAKDQAKERLADLAQDALEGKEPGTTTAEKLKNSKC
ncbi:hypothetical protein BGZ83_011113 [Gryganskiella cystojenkinii]|nr:hypothetical protein BGZ83_011113 [Gryganskiella cystojenkinii]